MRANALLVAPMLIGSLRTPYEKWYRSTMVVGPDVQTDIVFRSEHRFSRILPAAVRSVSTREKFSPSALCVEEQAIVANAVERRKSEFATGRMCAHHLLATLGRRHQPILRDDKGAPVWPPGIVGSITHCHLLVAAAVSSHPGIASVGIDAESNEALPEGVSGIVCTDGELRLLAELTRFDPTVAWDRLIFSAKESVYKAWYPVMSEWLGFHDVALHVDALHGTFRAVLSDERAPAWPFGPLTGKFEVSQGVIVTALCVTRDQRSNSMA